MFSNAINSSNVHFQSNSGTLEVADRLRVSTTGSTFNLGMTLAAGTFSVTGANGTALSATNPAYVILQDRSSPGLNKIFTVTANQTFIDDAGASTIIGNLFGYTTGVAVTTDVPFFLYAVSNDAEDTVSFMVSRIPHRLTAPAAGSIGKTGSAVADTQGSFFALGDPTVADYDSNPCTCIGSFKMRMSAADDWTVQALGAQDGIGGFNDGTHFTIPRGQNGAASGKYFLNNGGTAPDGSSGGGNYTISKAGTVNYYFGSGLIDTAGVGAVTLIFALPYVSLSGGICWHGVLAAAGGSRIILQGNTVGSTASTQNIYYANDVGVGSLNDQDLVINDSVLSAGTFLASTA